ncbi:Hypothetical predicted protein [Podarcis lilfordi]|uniref:Uncharacterized protein n=1 Tax=Podarcis lilfordi TaxID=74358 RepID=A0AA35JVF4_9SAUR|nr:Hypothetical predicted protein [Podarcis lilfordi]
MRRRHRSQISLCPTFEWWWGFEMSKNDDDQQFTIDNAIKNMDKMSSELNKLMVKTQLLLCDLILNFSHPALTDVSTEADEKKREESTNL